MTSGNRWLTLGLALVHLAVGGVGAVALLASALNPHRGEVSVALPLLFIAACLCLGIGGVLFLIGTAAVWNWGLVLQGLATSVFLLIVVGTWGAGMKLGILMLPNDDNASNYFLPLLMVIYSLLTGLAFLSNLPAPDPVPHDKGSK